MKTLTLKDTWTSSDSVDKNLPAKCRGYGFDSWFGKIPHAVEQFKPERLTTTEPTHPRAVHPQGRVAWPTATRESDEDRGTTKNE